MHTSLLKRRWRAGDGAQNERREKWHRAGKWAAEEEENRAVELAVKLFILWYRLKRLDARMGNLLSDSPPSAFLAFAFFSRKSC